MGKKDTAFNVEKNLRHAEDIITRGGEKVKQKSLERRPPFHGKGRGGLAKNLTICRNRIKRKKQEQQTPVFSVGGTSGGKKPPPRGGVVPPTRSGAAKGFAAGGTAGVRRRAV